MDNFIVSARKYRPATFKSVVGQAAITNTLKNAIKNHQIAQAFLFTGPRGVGKTTCARIMAKTINCSNITPEGEACNTCSSCMSFEKSASFNIFELDAASNNSVEDIRNLVDQVRIPPQHGYKVYIVDEVHMLSTAAFNAFLKTLEEPPAYAKFILATTEKHKILPTILSRCQIFDFRRISVDDISHHLDWVAKNENIEAEPEALHIIAEKADGGLRDALSMFDQLVSYAGNKLSYKQVIDNLNVLDHEYYFRITDFILEGDISNTLVTFNEIIENGFEGQHFITGLGQHMRNLMVSKDNVTLQLLETSAAIKEQFYLQSSKCSIPFILDSLEIINECDINYKTSNSKKLHVEISLMLLCRLMMPKDTNIQTTIKTQPAASLPVKPVTSTPQSPTSPVKTQLDQPKLESEIQQVEESKSNYQVTETSVIKEDRNIATQERKQPQALKPTITTYSGLNLGNLMAGKEMQTTGDTKEEDEKEIEESYGEELVSQSELEKVWPIMVDAVLKDQPALHSTLLMTTPILCDNGVITVSIENSIQKESIFNSQREITLYLRKKLKNSSLSINTVIVESKSEGRKPYTDTEKFNFVAEKAPIVRTLKEQLGLELEM